MTPSILLRTRTSAPDDFGWVRKLSESLADAMCSFMPGQGVTANVQGITESRYSQWSPLQPACSLLMPFELGKDSGEIVVHVPGQLISQILDLQYGGSGDVPPRNSFSTSEMRLVARLSGHLLPFINRAMLGILAEPAKAMPVQTDLPAFDLPQYRDSIVLAKIAIEPAGLKSTTISCFVGYAQAKKMALRFADANPTQLPAEPEWQTKMQNAALRVTLPARAILTQADFPVSRLLSLRAGDILPVLLPTDVPLTVGGRQFARGSIGESNGRAALKIENMEGFYSE
jgi:flagellar motor switch protein FliM